MPEPEGPTRTTNSPSAIERSNASTATVPSSKTLVSSLYSMLAISHPLRRRGDPVAIPERAPLRDAPLRLEVDVDDPEALRVPVLPLEVVEQRPDEVAAHVDPGGDRLLDGREVPLDVGDPERVLDHVGAVEAVVEGGAVLGDQQRQVAVVALQPDEQLRQRLGTTGQPIAGPVGVLRYLARPSTESSSAATRFGR